MKRTHPEERAAVARWLAEIENRLTLIHKLTDDAIIRDSTKRTRNELAPAIRRALQLAKETPKRPAPELGLTR